MRITMKLTVPLLVLAGLGLAGCGSSDPSYYTLRQWPGMAQSGGPLTLKIRTPSVASSLDRDYIVSNDQGYKLKLDHDAAWSEPLADMIGQTLAQDLTQRLPGTTVFTQAGAISTEAQATVELDIVRFSQGPDGQEEISGSLSVQRPDSGPSMAVPLHVTMPPNGAGTAGQVAALSQLLGQVADMAAQQARRLGPMPAGISGGMAGGAPAAGVPVSLSPG